MTPTNEPTQPREVKEPETKSYKDPVTGRVETAVPGSDVEKALIEQGYVEIDPETGEYKDPKAAEKAAAGSAVKPLNPDAKVQTPEDMAAAKDAGPAAPTASSESGGQPQAPAVPKKLNREADKP